MRRFPLLFALMGAALAGGGQDTGERMVRVTEGTNFAVAASPDGAQLVMDLQGTLWLLPAAGGAAEALTDGLGDDRLPDFHPDGDRVAYQSYRSGTWDIWQLALPSGEPERLTTTGFDDREPAWSPDGERIAFSSDRGGTYDIWLLEVATGETTPLTSGLGNESQPAWTPDGDGIVFVATPEGDVEGTVQWVSPEAESEPVAVPETGGMIAAPAVSPEGTHVVFRRLLYEGLLLMGSRFDIGTASEWVVAPFPGEADVSDSEGDADPPEREGDADPSDREGALRTLAGGGEDIFPFRPQWLDARTLLYTADGGIRRLEMAGDPAAPEEASAGAGEATAIPMSAELAVRRPPERRGRIRTESEEPRPVRGIIRPSISPDGTRLLYAALGDIWTAPLDGSEAPLPVTRDTWLDTDPVWLPDGASVLFASDRGGTMDIWGKTAGLGTPGGTFPTNRQARSRSESGGYRGWLPDRLARRIGKPPGHNPRPGRRTGRRSGGGGRVSGASGRRHAELVPGRGNHCPGKPGPLLVALPRRAEPDRVDLGKQRGSTLPRRTDGQLRNARFGRTGLLAGRKTARVRPRRGARGSPAGCRRDARRIAGDRLQGAGWISPRGPRTERRSSPCPARRWFASRPMAAAPRPSGCAMNSLPRLLRAVCSFTMSACWMWRKERFCRARMSWWKPEGSFRSLRSASRPLRR